MLKPRLRIGQWGTAIRRPRIAPAATATTTKATTIVAARRHEHTIPTLQHLAEAPVSGIPQLYTPSGFNIAYTQYMGFVTERLNHHTAGDELANSPAEKIIAATAREPDKAPIFNYASMSFNTHFYFEQLHADAEPRPIPQRLEDALNSSFGNIKTLQREFYATAGAMFGPGFVWLVKTHKNARYRVLPTYLAGSPLPTAHWRRQGFDYNSVGPTTQNRGGQSLATDLVERTAKGAGTESGAQWHTTAANGIACIPLLCVSTWQHSWLPDYGHGGGGKGGKGAFLQNWWNHIDWEKVLNVAQINAQELITTGAGHAAVG